MMYDAVPEQMLEQALVKAADDYLNAEDSKDKIVTNKIFCDVIDRTIKLISVQDNRAKDEATLEAAKEKDAAELEFKQKQYETSKKKDTAELEFKQKQFEAEEKHRKKETEIKSNSIELEIRKEVNQRLLDIVKFGVGTLVTIGLNLLYIRFDAKGNMFTTSFGRKRADESTRLKF